MSNWNSGREMRVHLSVAAPLGLVVALASSLWLATFSPPAGAQWDGGRPPYSAADWALLPEWCIDSQDYYGSPSWGSGNPKGRNGSPRSDHWTSIFGTDFWHMHHFCRALWHERQIDRAEITSDARRAAAQSAIIDFKYVVDRCAETMPLMPEVHYRMGVMYLRLGALGQAQEAFGAARRLKPDYWPAYTRWADELLRLRLDDRAATLIEDGLRHASDQPELLQYKQRIDARRQGAAAASPVAPSR